MLAVALSNSYTFWVWHFPILTLSSSDTFQLWHFPILALSNSDTFQFWHFPILTLPNSDTSETIFFWHFLLMTFSDSDTFKFWHLPILTLSLSDTFKFWPCLCADDNHSEKSSLCAIGTTLYAWKKTFFWKTIEEPGHLPISIVWLRLKNQYVLLTIRKGNELRLHFHLSQNLKGVELAELWKCTDVMFFLLWIFAKGTQSTFEITVVKNNLLEISGNSILTNVVLVTIWVWLSVSTLKMDKPSEESRNNNSVSGKNGRDKKWMTAIQSRPTDPFKILEPQNP